MQRGRLKNIINKSKTISNKQEVGNPFDEFKQSLPIEVDDNYRLEAAWKAYGSPKDYKTALWYGMIQPMDETNVKLPSIGYNEETEEYEYLNQGKDNEIVAKDIRVWDNDVIPLVKELKQGGYIRIFNEEKNCWTYSKTIQKETPMDQESGSQEQTSEGVEFLKEGGQMNVIPEGALHARKNNMELAKEGMVTSKGVPVVDNDGEQQAEIEREEIIFSKDTTEKIECFYKSFNEEGKTDEEKDKLAIKCGKFLTDQILNNTDDKTGLIQEVEQKM